MQKLFIDGSAGKIEVVLAEPNAPPTGIAIIAHPHPLFGGTMDNKVVHTLFKAFLELGLITVKFNFRSVGNSEGTHDNGVGEVCDVISVTQAVQDQFNCHSASLPLLLAGFSFGGGIQLHAAQCLHPQSLVLVAPSVHATNAPLPHDSVKHVLIIHGNNDEIVSLETVLNWATPQVLPIIIIPGAEHFFHGKLIALKHIVHNFFRI